MTLGEELGVAQAEADANRVSLTQGVVTGFDWPNGLILANVSGGTVAMRYLGDAPLIGVAVWVAYFGKTPLCLGMVGRSSSGVVNVAAASGKVGVLGDDGVNYTGLGYLGSAPTVGQRVTIQWANGRAVVLGVPSFEQPGNGAPTVPVTVAPVAKTFTFIPTDSRNWYNNAGYGNGASGAEVWASSNNKGVYVYGGAIQAAIAGLEFVPGSMYVILSEYFNQFPSSLAQLGYTALSSLSGNPSPQSLRSIGDMRGGSSVNISDMEPAFRSGAAGGLAFNNGPGYHKYRAAGVENSGVIVGQWKA